MFKDLNPLLHSQLRLAIISLLMNVESAAFPFIKEKTGASSGNLSVQIKKLNEAGYIKVKKKFKNNYPETSCSITDEGVKAFQEYVEALNDYIKKI